MITCLEVAEQGSTRCSNGGGGGGGGMDRLCRKSKQALHEFEPHGQSQKRMHPHCVC